MAVIQVTQPKSTKITRLAFLSRFTDSEAIAIDLASIDNPSGTTQERANSAAIRRYLAKINAATFVDVTRQDTVDGVNALAAMGFITAQRAQEVLSDVISSNEAA